jgi:acetyltransferase-like isoleucine patch superfamily enzyme
MERFHDWKPPILKHGKLTKWNWLVLHPEKLKLGKYCDIGAFTLLACHNGIEIGEGAQLGSHCAVYSESTIDEKKGRVIIGRNARIGSHSVVMPGLTIGENAVVAACSFVNKNIPTGELWGGVPAKRIQKSE